jgi:hypothetical protein
VRAESCTLLSPGWRWEGREGRGGRKRGESDGERRKGREGRGGRKRGESDGERR